MEARDLSKSFGTLQALRGVSIEFLQGEIHAVVGENGAGKSTLMNILSGFLTPDGGQVLIGDVSLPLGRPDLARRLGIEMVHQHFTLVPEFTVAENLALSRTDGLLKRIDVAALAEPALVIGRNLGWDVSGRMKVRDLPVGVQQRVEILKCLSGNARVLILDEPTAVLSPSEVKDLFNVIRILRSEGRIVVLIAHKLDEVMALADRVTVLRQGEKVASARIEEVNAQKLASWMVGEMPPLGSNVGVATVEEGLTVRGLSVRGDRSNEVVRKVDFDVRKGEILGIGGVDGNGQVELAEVLAQVRNASTGEIRWRGRAIREAGPLIAYIPQDRQQDGLALSMSVLDNLLIQGISKPEVVKAGVISGPASRSWAQALIERFSIKVEGMDAPVSSLSGGNQQKIVVSRNLDQMPDVLVAVNPTRGLDVKATRYVREQITAARDAGAAVALFSTDLDELAELADRTVFMSRGELVEGNDAKALLGGHG